MDFLDKFTAVHRLPETFRRAMQHAQRRDTVIEDSLPPRPRMTWQETRDWLKVCGERAAREKVQSR